MDTSTLREAYSAFLAIAEAGDFADPPVGEWTAEQLLAHLVAADTGIAAVALAVAAGQRPSYDNRYSLDRWNLGRIVEENRDLAGLVEQVRRRGRMLCDVAEQLAEPELDTAVHCLILSGRQVMADAAQPLSRLIQGVAAVHLPRHSDQLAALRHTGA